MLTLLPISVLLGVAMLWVFSRTSNQAAIRAAKRRLQACLYEMRLFTDEPALVFRAQAGLLSANLRYIGLMLVPALVMTVPMALLFPYLEAFYGVAPLAPGQETIVTLQMKSPLDPAVPAPALEAPPEIAVETPAVRVLAERQISWRIRPRQPVSGALRFSLPQGTVEKKISAGPGSGLLSERRVSGIFNWLWHPAERPLPSGNVDWIEVRYPGATIPWLGLNLHWLIWLLLFSMLSALLLKKRFHVTF